MAFLVLQINHRTVDGTLVTYWQWIHIRLLNCFQNSTVSSQTMSTLMRCYSGKVVPNRWLTAKCTQGSDEGVELKRADCPDDSDVHGCAGQYVWNHEEQPTSSHTGELWSSDLWHSGLPESGLAARTQLWHGGAEAPNTP